jgi:hypothetical protein
LDGKTFFEVLSGGGQCMRHAYHGYFKDILIDGELALGLVYTTRETLYHEHNDEKYIPIRPCPVKKIKYSIKEVNKKFFDGYSLMKAKYEIVFKEDPFYYGEEHEKMIEKQKKENVKLTEKQLKRRKDMLIFYAQIENVECNTFLERAIRNVNRYDYKVLNKNVQSKFGIEMNKPTLEQVENVIILFQTKKEAPTSVPVYNMDSTGSTLLNQTTMTFQRCKLNNCWPIYCSGEVYVIKIGNIIGKITKDEIIYESWKEKYNYYSDDDSEDESDNESDDNSNKELSVATTIKNKMNMIQSLLFN